MEGNPNTIPALGQRLRADNPLADRLRIVQGLAGEPSGAAPLYVSADSPGDSSAVRPSGRPGMMVLYVDLDGLVEDAPILDLLKCDIEGAELLVIEQYPRVLQKTRVVVVELHTGLCDVDRGRALQRAAGLGREIVLLHVL